MSNTQPKLFNLLKDRIWAFTYTGHLRGTVPLSTKFPHSSDDGKGKQFLIAHRLTVTINPRLFC